MGAFSIRTKTFRLDLADYLALWLSPRLIAPAVCGGIGLLIALPLALDLSDLMHGDIRTSLVTTAISLTYLVVSFTATLSVRAWRYRRNAMMTGERIMIFDDGAVRLIGPGFDVRQPWTNFAYLSQGRRYLFLVMHTNQVYVIPKAALAGGDVKRLVACARAALGKDSAAPEVLPLIPEPPDNREIWLTRPYRMTFHLIFPRLSRLTGPLTLILTGTIGLILASAAWMGRRGGLHDALGLAGGLAIVGLLLVSMLPVITRLNGLRPDVRGERTFCFTRDYIRSIAPAFDGRYSWDTVRQVRRASGAFVFRLASGQFAVPVSAFATPAQAMAFYTQAVAFWRAAEARR